MSSRIGSGVKTGLALALAAGVVTSAVVPAQAGGGGAFAAGLFGGTALGLLVGSAVASHPPVYYAPGPYGPGPYGPHCWLQPEQIWNGYAYVVQRVQVCN